MNQYLPAEPVVPDDGTVGKTYRHKHGRMRRYGSVRGALLAEQAARIHKELIGGGFLVGPTGFSSEEVRRILAYRRRAAKRIAEGKPEEVFTRFTTFFSDDWPVD